MKFVNFLAISFDYVINTYDKNHVNSNDMHVPT